MKILFSGIITLCSLAFFSCSGVSALSPRMDAKFQDLSNQITALQLEVSYLKGKLEVTEKRLEDLSKIQAATVQQSDIKSTSSNSSNSQAPTNLKEVPPKSTTSKSVPKESTKSIKESQTTSSGRCQAYTKKGTQCKRNAQPGRNYCWQH